YAQVIEERTSGLVVASYVYGASLDPVSQWQAGQGFNLYLADGHSGVRQAIDNGAAVLMAQRFDAFGNTVASTGSLVNPIGYRGERFDATLGQYDLRARFYDPQTARFAEMDPFAGDVANPITLHRYLYAGDDPVNHLDPTGRDFAGFGFTAATMLGYSA